MKIIKPVTKIRLTAKEEKKAVELNNQQGTTYQLNMFKEIVVPRMINAIKGVYEITWYDLAAALETIKKEKRTFRPRLTPDEYDEEMHALDEEIRMCRSELNRRDLHWLDRRAYRKRLKAAISQREFNERCGRKFDRTPPKNPNLIETPWRP